MFHTAADNPGCRLGCLEELDCFRHYNCCPILLDHLNLLWPGTHVCISPTAIFNDVLFKIGVRIDRLCILVSGLLGAFVTAFNLRRTHRGLGLNFKEFTYGKTKMMTALCPAWAHTYQTMCLGFNLEQLKHEAFRLPKTKKQFSMLPTCRISIRMTGIESPSWRLFIDGGFKRQAGGTDAAGWGTAAASPDNFVRILCGPVMCDPRRLAFLGATSCSNLHSGAHRLRGSPPMDQLVYPSW